MIVYFYGSAIERSGVRSFGLALAQQFPTEVILVGLNSTEDETSTPSHIKVPIWLSHRPSDVTQKVFSSRSQWPNRVKILPNDSNCAYEVASQLCMVFQEIGTHACTIGVVHANTSSSIGLLESNAFLVVRAYVVSQAILNRISPANREGLRCRVLPYALSVSYLRNIKSRLDTREETCGLRIIYVGRLVEDQKRASRLLDLIQLLRSISSCFSIEVIGDGHLAEEFVKVSSYKGASACYVHLRGNVSQEEVIERISDSDVLVLTSEFEGSPLVVMEALSVGTVPVVMNYGVEVRELIRDGENGYVVEQGDVPAMASVLVMLSNDRRKLKRVGRSAYESSRNFTTFGMWREEIIDTQSDCCEINRKGRTSYMESIEVIRRGVKTLEGNQKLLIWGGGNIGRLIVDELVTSNYNLEDVIIIDRVLSSYLSDYRNVPIFSPKDFPRREFDIAIIASDYYLDEIRVSIEVLRHDLGPNLKITSLRDWR